MLRDVIVYFDEMPMTPRSKSLWCSEHSATELDTSSVPRQPTTAHVPARFRLTLEESVRRNRTPRSVLVRHEHRRSKGRVTSPSEPFGVNVPPVDLLDVDAGYFEDVAVHRLGEVRVKQEPNDFGEKPGIVRQGSTNPGPASRSPRASPVVRYSIRGSLAPELVLTLHRPSDSK